MMFPVPKDYFKTNLLFFFAGRISEEDHQRCVDKVDDCNNPQHPTVINHPSSSSSSSSSSSLSSPCFNFNVFRFKSTKTYHENPTDLTILPLIAGPEIWGKDSTFIKQRQWVIFNTYHSIKFWKKVKRKSTFMIKH